MCKEMFKFLKINTPDARMLLVKKQLTLYYKLKTKFFERNMTAFSDVDMCFAPKKCVLKRENHYNTHVYILFIFNNQQHDVFCQT